MKVSEAVKYMTKSYLHRIIDSFTKDFQKGDESKSREIIIKNTKELTNSERIRAVLKLNGPWSDQILVSYILEALVNSLDYAASEEYIIKEVTNLEKQIISEANDPESLRYEKSGSVEIIKSVIEVAIEDDHITIDELNLIKKLRRKLNISPRSMKIILAQLDHFPQAENKVHTPSKFRDILIDLQRRGVVFYCNQLNGGRYVIPEEIVSPVKEEFGIELSRKAYEMLLDELSKSQLSSILEVSELPKYGNKEELQTRVIQAGIVPSKALDSLSNDDLYKICSSLPGAKVSGSKQTKIQRVIDYFSNLVIKEVSKEATPGERYYKYYVELASRDRENLLANKVIKKDIEMERAFEEATRYLFEKKLNLETIDLPGTDHCDGCMKFKKSGNLFMWDNKSKESTYTFPPSHFRQFKRYIRDATERVSCFLIIAPEIAEEATYKAAKLKVDSGSDTDIALIAAEDLLWLAEYWSEEYKEADFNLNVFNMTGIITRPLLENRLKLFT